MREMETLMSQYDVFLSPTASASLGMTNLTGHPAIALKAGFYNNAPVELMITGGCMTKPPCCASRSPTSARRSGICRIQHSRK